MAAIAPQTAVECQSRNADLEDENLRQRLTLALDIDISRRRDYQVTLIRAGDTLHDWRFPPAVVQAAASLFQGASCFVDHLGFMEQAASVRNLVGVIADVTWDASVAPRGGLRGRLSLSKTPAAEWMESLIDQIIEDREAGLPVPDVGLSADLFAGYYLDGRVRVASEIRQVYSVDVVFYPASGGSFDRILNSVTRVRQESGGGAEMFVEKQKVEEAKVATASQGGVRAAATKSDGLDTELGAGEVARVEQTAVAIEGASAADAAAQQAQELLRAQCQTVLEGALTWCDLPQPMKDAVRTQFSGRVFAPETLDAEIERYRGMLAGMLEQGVIRGAGDALDGARVTGMLDSLERVQLAFERLMGLPIPEEHSDIPRLSGIRELYLLMTGDYDFYGTFNRDRVRLSNVTTASMTSVVKNVLNKVLLQAYNVRPRWWAPIAYEEDFGSLNQITWMKTGGIGSLPTVSEGGAYTELDWSDAEEKADFVKKGGYIGITLEMMDRDDVGAVKRIPRELGNAAWRTLSTLVSAIFTDNSGIGPVLACGHNVFDASNHGNLRTAALSADEWDNVIQAVYQQTEPGSSAQLALRPQFCLVPIELERTALSILEQPWSVEATYHYLEPRYQSGRVIVVPEWTDANDWAAACDPNDCPGICIGYRYGREPELFVADDQTVGSMFTNDEMRIKCRFFVAVGVADYRPLHKSNVA
jgi:hypothetical protein